MSCRLWLSDVGIYTDINMKFMHVTHRAAGAYCDSLEISVYLVRWNVGMCSHYRDFGVRSKNCEYHRDIDQEIYTPLVSSYQWSKYHINEENYQEGLTQQLPSNSRLQDWGSQDVNKLTYQTTPRFMQKVTRLGKPLDPYICWKNCFIRSWSFRLSVSVVKIPYPSRLFIKV